MKVRRILAYFFDMFFVMFISSCIFVLPVFKDSYENYTELSEKVVNSFNDDDKSDAEIIDLEYDLYKASSNLLIIKLGISFFYFAILGFIFNGRTLGKKLFRLRIIPMGDKYLRPGLYVFRSLLVNNIVLDLISLLSILFGSRNTWLVVNSLTGILSYLISFVLLLVMLFNINGRSLHDYLFKTAVIYENKNL